MEQNTEASQAVESRMRKLWRWLLGPAWVESECGKWRTDPATGQVQIWDTADIDEFHGGYWR